MHLPKRDFCSESHLGFTDGKEVESAFRDMIVVVVRERPEDLNAKRDEGDKESWVIGQRTEYRSGCR